MGQTNTKFITINNNINTFNNTKINQSHEDFIELPVFSQENPLEKFKTLVFNLIEETKLKTNLKVDLPKEFTDSGSSFVLFSPSEFEKLKEKPREFYKVRGCVEEEKRIFFEKENEFYFSLSEKSLQIYSIFHKKHSNAEILIHDVVLQNTVKEIIEKIENSLEERIEAIQVKPIKETFELKKKIAFLEVRTK
jgi:protease II